MLTLMGLRRWSLGSRVRSVSDGMRFVSSLALPRTTPPVLQGLPLSTSLSWISTPYYDTRLVSLCGYGNATGSSGAYGAVGALASSSHANRSSSSQFVAQYTSTASSSEEGSVTQYRLKDSEKSPELKKELENFFKFMTVPFFGQLEERIRHATAIQYLKRVELALGWLKHVQNESEPIRLKNLVPTPEKHGAAVLFDYIQWHIQRGTAANTREIHIRAFIQVAKFLYRHEAESDDDKPYSNIKAIKAMRKIQCEAAKLAKISQTHVDKEWTTWPEYLSCVNKLKQECDDLKVKYDREGIAEKDGKKIALKIRLYLMLGILSCIPDRQRTLRELKVGRTLFKEIEKKGNTTTTRWVIKHKAEDYKTGKVYGDRPPLVIAPQFYPYLEEYLNKWRQFLKPNHDFVFSSAKGSPLSLKIVTHLFVINTKRIIGKAVTPHSIRNMIVTYLKSRETSERDLEALALYMGHSVQIQKKIYDRRTTGAKVAPAVSLLQNLLNEEIEPEENEPEETDTHLFEEEIREEKEIETDQVDQIDQVTSSSPEQVVVSANTNIQEEKEQKKPRAKKATATSTKSKSKTKKSDTSKSDK